MKFLSITLIAFSITIFIFIIAGIAKVGSTNEIALGEEFKSKSGDWVVTGIETRSNEIIPLTGSLIVQSGGNLTLDNVTLKMNCSYDGQYNIEVQDGGRLYAYNNSNITASTYKAHYPFWVRAGSILILENTNLSYCGYTSKSDSDYSYGLYICSSNVLITNCILEENNWGIYYEQNTCQAGKARIENNIITNNSHGISVYGGRNYCAAPYIANNTISFSDSHGIYCTHDYSEIINNTISYNGGNGIFCYESYTSIENNSLLSNGKNGIEVAAGSCIEKITGNKIENSNYGIYCYSTGATTSISNLSDNTILNGSEGIYCAESSVDNIYNNTIKNLNSCGIHIVRARSECSISWNNITECGIGIYCDDTSVVTPKNKTIAYNNISFSTDSGLYCRYSSPQVTAGNKFSNNRLAINLSGASAEVDYLNNTFENNTEGILLQEWHLKVRVRVDGENEEDAQVIVKNKTGEIVLNKPTNSAGYIEGYVTEYKILNDYNKESYTPHTITANKTYSGNTSKVISITDNTLEILDLTIPELEAKEITVSGFLSEGQNITIGVIVFNNGSAPAQNVLVRFLCNDLSWNRTISSIADGDNRETSITWVAVKGVHLFEVRVDPEHSIDEKANFTENNNCTKFIPINAKPVARLVIMPSTVDTYVDVTFNASLSNDTDGIVTEYRFEFGDVGYGNNTGWTTLSAVKHNYTKWGSYRPRIKVRDNFTQDGFVAESDFYIGETITVLNRPPVPYIIAKVNEIETKEANTSDQIIFYGDKSYDGEALYGGATLHPIVNYTWGMGDDRYRYGAVISYSYSENGTYNVTLTVRDDDNEERTAFLLIVINNRLPSSLFSIEPVVGYVTTIFTFNASSSADPDGNIIKYYWDFGDGTTLETSQSIITHQFADDGNYTVTLVVHDNDYMNSTPKELGLQILNTPPTALFSLIKSVVFVNEQVEFNASLSFDLDDAISYTWDFGDGTKGYGMLVNHTYTQLGRYFVTLTVFDDEVNTTYPMIIEIKPLPTWIELHYKEVYIVGAIFCILGAIFFSLRWYEEAKRKEKEVKLWAEKKGAEKETKIEVEVEEWAEKKKKLKAVDERIREWAKKREVAKKAKEEKAEKELTEWAEKKEAKKKKEQSN